MKTNLFEAPWGTLTFVVFQNELRNTINRNMIKMNSNHQIKHVIQFKLSRLTQKIQYIITYNIL